MFIFSYCYYFGGSLVTGVVVGGIFTIFEVIVYASLISAMPRAGGDYVWQSRILGRGLGFVLAVTGWWFILWLWVPLYGQMLAYEVLHPACWPSLGLKDAALWFTTDPGACWSACCLVCLIVFIYIAIGMKWYARVQKFCFWGGMVGPGDRLRPAAVRQQCQPSSPTSTPLLPAVRRARRRLLYQPPCSGRGGRHGLSDRWRRWPLGASIALIPMMIFFNLWPNWGSTLYGEVRGASDYKRNFWGMAAAIIVTAVLALIFFALIAKTIGWDFYNKANGAFWNYTLGYTTDASPLPIWPYPALFAAFLVKSPAASVHRRPADEPVVVRLVGHGLPELDPRDLRRRHRPHAAGVGLRRSSRAPRRPSMPCC